MVRGSVVRCIERMFGQECCQEGGRSGTQIELRAKSLFGENRVLTKIVQRINLGSHVVYNTRPLATGQH